MIEDFKVELKNLHPEVIKFLDETGYKYTNGERVTYYCNAAIIKKEDDKLYLISDILFAKELGKDELMNLRFGQKYFQFRKQGHYFLPDMKKAFEAGKALVREPNHNDTFNEFIKQLNKEK